MGYWIIAKEFLKVAVKKSAKYAVAVWSGFEMHDVLQNPGPVVQDTTELVAQVPPHPNEEIFDLIEIMVILIWAIFAIIIIMVLSFFGVKLKLKAKIQKEAVEQYVNEVVEI